MRKKLIDSTKADIKKYMMIVESAGKVPASTREDFELEDIENPYFQGDEDTEESEGNRYYVTVGVKIGYDENTDSYFPEVIWDQETGTEIEFDKLDKISKKSIQDKCDAVGAKIHVQRKGVNESTQIVVKALMQKFKISESKAKSIVAKVSESLAPEKKVGVTTIKSLVSSVFDDLFKQKGFVKTKSGWEKTIEGNTALISLGHYSGLTTTFIFDNKQRYNADQLYIKAIDVKTGKQIEAVDVSSGLIGKCSSIVRKINDSINAHYKSKVSESLVF